MQLLFAINHMQFSSAEAVAVTISCFSTGHYFMIVLTHLGNTAFRKDLMTENSICGRGGLNFILSWLCLFRNRYIIYCQQ